MINLEKKESDKKIIYAQAQKEQIEFNNRFNQVKNQFLTNIIRENRININLPTDYNPINIVGYIGNGNSNNGNNTDENEEEEVEIIEEATIQPKNKPTVPRSSEQLQTVQSKNIASGNPIFNQPKQALNTKSMLFANPSPSSIVESRFEQERIREEYRIRNYTELDQDNIRRNDTRKQPTIVNIDNEEEDNQKKRKESEGNIFQKHTRKKVKHE